MPFLVPQTEKLMIFIEVETGAWSPIVVIQSEPRTSVDAVVIGAQTFLVIHFEVRILGSQPEKGARTLFIVIQDECRVPQKVAENGAGIPDLVIQAEHRIPLLQLEIGAEVSVIVNELEVLCADHLLSDDQLRENAGRHHLRGCRVNRLPGVGLSRLSAECHHQQQNGSKNQGGSHEPSVLCLKALQSLGEKGQGF
jgi:hypothetical protein